MPTPTIDVTVIVPMRQEARRIGGCLLSIVANDFPHERLEVLVADGLSTDGSRAVAEELAARFPFIRVLSNPAKIVSAGLNLGIRAAQGRVIIIIGAHTEIPKNYIRRCVEELDRTQADVVGGVLRTEPGANTRAARAVALMTQHPFGVGGSAFRTRRTTASVDTVPYGAYRREVFAKVGWFNEELVRNQDFEFNARVRRAGGKLLLAPDLEITYYNVPDGRRLAAQAFNNGRWLAQMWLTSPVSFRRRHSVPLILVLVLLVCAVVSPFTTLAAVCGGLVLLAYAAAAVGAAWQISRREGAQFLFPVMRLFFAQHFAYGAGTLVGLLRSAMRPLPAMHWTAPVKPST